MAALSRQQIKTLYDQAVAMMRAGQIAQAAQAFADALLERVEIGLPQPQLILGAPTVSIFGAVEHRRRCRDG